MSPVNGAASATASDDAAPADDSRAPTASLSGVAEGTVPLAVDAAFDAAVSSAGAGALAAPPTDIVGKTVPPVAGAAAGTAVDAAPADDVGASTTADDSRAPTAPLNGVAEGTVPLAVGAS